MHCLFDITFTRSYLETEINSCGLKIFENYEPDMIAPSTDDVDVLQVKRVHFLFLRVFSLSLTCPLRIHFLWYCIRTRSNSLNSK